MVGVKKMAHSGLLFKASHGWRVMKLKRDAERVTVLKVHAIILNCAA